MKNTSLISALAVMIFAIAGGVMAQPNKEQYELQEHCGRREEECSKAPMRGARLIATIRFMIPEAKQTD